MSGVDIVFRRLREKDQKAFIPYITCGDPSLKKTMDLLDILEKNGADIIELGIPHSDPVADGKTIQNSVNRALRNGTTPYKVLRILKNFRKKSEIPIVLLTYYNIILQYGIENFVADFSEFSDGVIVADLPPEESKELVRHSRRYDFSTVFLASPLTSKKRLKKILDLTTGFLYAVSLLGVTGEREKLSHDICKFMKEMRPITDLPICVGFGISKQEHVFRILSMGADGVIVGSGVVRRLNNIKELEKYLQRISIPTKNNPKSFYNYWSEYNKVMQCREHMKK